MSEKRTPVSSPEAPAAVGPYSHAVVAGGFVFTSGQIPLDPATGKLVPGDIEAQTERVLQNLGAVLDAAGTSLARVVKTTLFLVDLADFGRVNAVYGKHFPKDPPARSTVQVAALPLGAAIEIECVALLP
ncbi:MAG TPA: RidA family protein [Polyangiaceae bacterium]|nr:RidA family protein [Polyangiaceae bacterium]